MKNIKRVGSNLEMMGDANFGQIQKLIKALRKKLDDLQHKPQSKTILLESRSMVKELDDLLKLEELM